MKNYVITVARGFGTGGKQIAMKVAEELGFQCYDNRIVSLASKYSEIDLKYFQDEKLNGAYWNNALMKLPMSKKPVPVLSPFVSDPKMFDIQSEIIRRLADTENCVIVGRCGDHILRDRENVISIYVEAPRDYCVKRLKERMPGISDREANKMISKTDKYRKDYYKYNTGGKAWNNVTNYDLTINPARVGEDTAVEMVVEYVKHRRDMDAKREALKVLERVNEESEE